MVIAMANGFGPLEFAKSITILKALFMLKEGSFSVKTKKKIANCFIEAGFVREAPVRENEPEIVEDIT